MKYNIDTKENFDIITPINDIFNQELAVNIHEFMSKSILKNRSLIVDFSNLKSIEESLSQNIIDWHHELYNTDLSFAMCCMTDDIKNVILKNKESDVLNITPKQIEAIDLVSMEGLERELMGDDDFDF